MKAWKDEFLITVWGVPDVSDLDASAKALADADFNVVMWDADKLDICQKYGLKVLVGWVLHRGIKKRRKNERWNCSIKRPENGRRSAALQPSDSFSISSRVMANCSGLPARLPLRINRNK